MIGCAKECAELYLLKGPSKPKKQAQHASSVFFSDLYRFSDKHSAIML